MSLTDLIQKTYRKTVLYKNKWQFLLTTKKIANIIDNHSPDSDKNGLLIVRKARKKNVPLALMCAQINAESRFKNIFGCDFGPVGDQPPYCRHRVTKERAQKLLHWAVEKRSGNGVGPMQITYWTFLVDADERGGLHRVSAQLDVAFELMNYLLTEHSPREALARYNGGSNPPQFSYQYADNILADAGKWHYAFKRTRKKVTEYAERKV